MAQSNSKQYLHIEKMENDDIMIKARMNKRVFLLISTFVISFVLAASNISPVVQKIITIVLGG